MGKVFTIETPRGRIIEAKTPKGKITAKLEWNEGFGARKEGDFERAQVFVDSKCLDLIQPLTPRLTGAMIKSGTLGTALGTGQINYLTPYARRQYYENKGQGQRGRLWFERMKSQNAKQIMKEANQIAAGK